MTDSLTAEPQDSSTAAARSAVMTTEVTGSGSAADPTATTTVPVPGPIPPAAGGDPTGPVEPIVDPAPERRRRLVDLSHPITEGMTTYPGIPAPTLGSHLTFEESAAHYAAGTEFQIGTITMAANTGTYLDTPAHRYRDGDDLGAFPLERMADLDGLVVRVGSAGAADDPAAVFIDEQRLQTAIGDRAVTGRALLIETGHSAKWGQPGYFRDHPHLTDGAVEYLLTLRPVLVGIDSLNIDGTHTGRRPAHSWLLAAGVPVVEHLTRLDELPDEGFRFTAAPPAVVGMATFPVRAFAVVD